MHVVELVYVEGDVEEVVWMCFRGLGEVVERDVCVLLIFTCVCLSICVCCRFLSRVYGW